MSSVVKWGLISLLLSILGGCNSEKNSSSRLPWAVPANWELHRDITTDINVQKVYRPSDVNVQKTCTPAEFKRMKRFAPSDLDGNEFIQQHHIEVQKTETLLDPNDPFKKEHSIPIDLDVNRKLRRPKEIGTIKERDFSTSEVKKPKKLRVPSTSGKEKKIYKLSEFYEKK